MKRPLVIITTILLTSMSGCLISSIHPFFKQKDKIFDEAMTGCWIDGDSSLWVIEPNMVSESFMGPSKNDSTYKITFYEEEDREDYFTGTLFRLKGVNYVDFFPDPDEDHCKTDFTSWHHIPTHTLARVQFNRDSILLYWYAEEWLNDLFEQNRIRIKHETIEFPDYQRNILTAPTDELQKFIKKYANDEKTSEEIERIFARGYTNDQEEYGIVLKLKPYDGPLPEKKANQVQSE